MLKTIVYASRIHYIPNIGGGTKFVLCWWSPEPVTIWTKTLSLNDQLCYTIIPQGTSSVNS